MMRFCHSFWSKPALHERWGIKDRLTRNLWLFALSVHYVKKHGHALVLHTDELGSRVFGILPYDEIYRTLDGFSMPEAFWASGKAHVLKTESVGTVHIDGDVFMKVPWVYRRIETPDYDVIVQSYDWCDAFIKMLKILRPYLIKRAGFLFGATDNHSDKVAYNAGVIGFRNRGLRDEYVDIYMGLVRYLGRSHALMAQLNSNFERLSADLVLEQKLLCVMAGKGGYRVQRIIPEDIGLWTMLVEKYRDSYEHLISNYKYQRLEHVKRELKQENPQLHQQVDRHIRELANAAVS